MKCKKLLLLLFFFQCVCQSYFPYSKKIIKKRQAKIWIQAEWNELQLIALHSKVDGTIGICIPSNIVRCFGMFECVEYQPAKLPTHLNIVIWWPKKNVCALQNIPVHLSLRKTQPICESTWRNIQTNSTDKMCTDSASFAIVDPNTQHFPIRLRLTMKIHLNGMYRLCRFLHTDLISVHSDSVWVARIGKTAWHWHASSSLFIQPLFIIWEKSHFALHSWLPDLHVRIYGTDIQHVPKDWLQGSEATPYTQHSLLARLTIHNQFKLHQKIEIQSFHSVVGRPRNNSYTFLFYCCSFAE